MGRPPAHPFPPPGPRSPTSIATCHPSPTGPPCHLPPAPHMDPRTTAALLPTWPPASTASPPKIVDAFPPSPLSPPPHLLPAPEWLVIDHVMVVHILRHHLLHSRPVTRVVGTHVPAYTQHVTHHTWLGELHVGRHIPACIQHVTQSKGRGIGQGGQSGAWGASRPGAGVGGKRAEKQGKYC